MLNAIDPIGFDDLGASTTQSQMAAYAHAFVVGLGHIAGQAAGNGTSPGYIRGVVDLGAINATAWNRLVDENVRPGGKTIPGDGAWAWGSQVVKGVESGYAAAREALYVNVVDRGNRTIDSYVGSQLAIGISIVATEGASELGSLATELEVGSGATSAIGGAKRVTQLYDPSAGSFGPGATRALESAAPSNLAQIIDGTSSGSWVAPGAASDMNCSIE